MWPHRPWQRVHIDYCFPFLGESFLVVVGAKSKWLEVLRMSSTTAEATVQALRVLFATHGLPEEIVSDNSPQFVAQVFKDFLKYNNIKEILSAPYHSESNGEAGRAVRTFKQAMKAAKKEPGTLSQKICSFLLSYHTIPHTATRCTPAELLMNRRLCARLDLLRPDLRKRVAKPAKLQPIALKRQPSVGDPVLVPDYRKSQDPWVKGVVVAKLVPVTYRVQVKVFFWKRHIDQLKDLSGIEIQPQSREQLEESVVPSSFTACSESNSPVLPIKDHFSTYEPEPRQDSRVSQKRDQNQRVLRSLQTRKNQPRTRSLSSLSFPSRRRYPLRDRKRSKRLIQQFLQ